MRKAQSGAIGRHRRLASALGGVASLLCCLALQLAAEQPPIIINRVRAVLGAPEEALPAKPTVLEFAPSPPPPVSVLLFEPRTPVLPTSPSVPAPRFPDVGAREFEPTSPSLPEASELPLNAATAPDVTGRLGSPYAPEQEAAEPVDWARFDAVIATYGGNWVAHRAEQSEPRPGAWIVPSGKTLPALTLAHELNSPLCLEYAGTLLPPLKGKTKVERVHFETPAPWHGVDLKWLTPPLGVPDPPAPSALDQMPAELGTPVIPDPEVRFGIPLSPPSYR